MIEQNSNVVVSAFTEDNVQRLTGISLHQLRYWDRTAFFVPSFAYEDRRSAYSRIYSFRDMLDLTVLAALRNDIGCSLPHLRDVKVKLAELDDAAWSRTILHVVKKKVVFTDPETGRPREIVSGQGILGIPLEVVRRNMTDAVKKLQTRNPDQVGAVTQNRNVSHNTPVIAGTRIPVRGIKEFVDAGYSTEQIIAEYPTLTEADIQAAMAHGRAA